MPWLNFISDGEWCFACDEHEHWACYIWCNVSWHTSMEIPGASRSKMNSIHRYDRHMYWAESRAPSENDKWSTGMAEHERHSERCIIIQVCEKNFSIGIFQIIFNFWKVHTNPLSNSLERALISSHFALSFAFTPSTLCGHAEQNSLAGQRMSAEAMLNYCHAWQM